MSCPIGSGTKVEFNGEACCGKSCQERLEQLKSKSSSRCLKNFSFHSDKWQWNVWGFRIDIAKFFPFSEWFFPFLSIKQGKCVVKCDERTLTKAAFNRCVRACTEESDRCSIPVGDFGKATQLGFSIFDITTKI